LASAPPAVADLVHKVVLSDSYGTTNGGEFLTTPIDFTFVPVSQGSGPAGTFETFCVETTETFQWGVTYFVDLNTAAVHGGAGGGDPDPLDTRTAYLYEQFITGQLDNYTYAGGALRTASADALQHVIWYLEDEEPMSWTPGDASLRDLFYQDATQNGGDSIGDVRILNLYGTAQGTECHQDQLVMTPEPASLLLLVLGGWLVGKGRR
jgi:hypothetical protein